MTAICTTSFGDVWTGNSRGVIRARRVSHSSGHISVSEPRELRRQGGMKAASHPISALVVPTCGQVSTLLAALDLSLLFVVSLACWP